MERNFIETEIKDLFGIATGKQNVSKNQLQEILNFDLREKTGNAILRNGYAQKYAAPTHSRITSIEYLDSENIYIQDYGQGREVTVVVAKGVLNRETGSGISPSTLNVPLIFARPFWTEKEYAAIQAGSTKKLIKTNLTLTEDQYKNAYIRILTSSTVPTSRNTGNFRKIISHTIGANAELTIDPLPYLPISGYYYQIFFWDDSWHWVNEMIYTKIEAFISSDQARPQIVLDGFDISENQYNGWVFTNLTASEHTTSLYNTAGGIGGDIEFGIADCNNTWNVDDVVLLQKSFIPLEYLYNMYEAEANDISFYSLLNELRISFGGQPNRLTLALGLRTKSFQIATLPTSYPAITGQNLVSILSSKQELMLDPFNARTENSTYVINASDTGTGSFPNKRYFIRATIFLDDHSEFLVYEGYHTIAAAKNLQLTVLAGATFNKRITALRLWLSEGVGTLDAAATNPYYLVKDIQFTQTDLDYDKQSWNYTDDGNLYYDFTITYDLFTDNLGEMQTIMGYAPTTNYADSFDQALIVNKTVLAINPHTDIRQNNIIYFSPESGEAVFQYDVLTGSNYYDTEMFDKNDLIAIGLLNNMDFAALKKNVYNQMDRQTGQTYQTHYEKGIITRRSLINTGNALFWCNENDILAANTQQINEVSEDTIRDQYRLLTATQKSNIIAAREEKDNAYRFYTGDTTNKTEFILTKRGFIKRKQNIAPYRYIQARDGSVWFMASDGKIYYESTNKLDVSTGFSFKLKTMPMDISVIGETIKSTDLFLVDKIWCRYTTKGSSLIFNMNLYLDGALFDTLPCNYTNTFEQKKVIPGGNAKIIELEITGTTSASNDNLEIISFGFLWTPMKAGIYATT